VGGLYDEFGGLLLAIGTRIVGDRAKAEDVLHDVFLEVWRKAHTYDPRRSSVRGWLVLRMRSRCLDYIKSAAVSRRRTIDIDRRTSDADPERDADAAKVAPLLDQLPAEQRQVLVLGYFGGMSSREIAESLAIPIGTVKSRIAAGLRKLRADVNEPGSNGGSESGAARPGEKDGAP
jgi:RNA polymerase sigma-70 factor (ECF subfamily)